MITRRRFVAAALAVPVVPVGSAMAQAVKEQPAKEADYLFVQTAKSMSSDKSTNKLNLEGVSSTTLFFSDRPERIAGNMKTTAFVPFWSKGKDSFLKDPPNADVSILEGDKLQQVVVVLQAPELKGDTLTYNVKVLQGDMPAKGADVSLFSTSSACLGRPYRMQASRGVVTGVLSCVKKNAVMLLRRRRNYDFV
jgi:hypothetical protein